MPKIHFYVALATATFLLVTGAVLTAGSTNGAGMFAGSLILFSGFISMIAVAIEAELKA